MHVGDSGMSPSLLVPLAILAVVQLVVTLWAVIKLSRAPQERLTLPFVAWLLIILLTSGLGAIIFLVAGLRRPVPPPPPQRPLDVSATRHAVDVLYGRRDG